MVNVEYHKSRKWTVWKGKTDLSPTQAFIRDTVEEHYNQRHPPLKLSGEAELINSYRPLRCPLCGSETFSKDGKTKNGIQRYRCKCGGRFTPTTGTIFDSHKISVSEWIEYSMNLFRHVSLNASSWNNRNAFTTSSYWLKKMFLSLEGSQNNIMLSGTVWLDETFYTVKSKDIVTHENGTKLRGISRNQMCIGVATDGTYSLFLLEGVGKPTQKNTYESFCNHIMPGSTLIHDGENAHRKLVKELSLESISYSANSLKGLSDKDNPLQKVNRLHFLLKHFLRSHTGFSRDYMQGYLGEAMIKTVF